MRAYVPAHVRYIEGERIYLGHVMWDTRRVPFSEERYRCWLVRGGNRAPITRLKRRRRR